MPKKYCKICGSRTSYRNQLCLLCYSLHKENNRQRYDCWFYSFHDDDRPVMGLRTESERFQNWQI